MHTEEKPLIQVIFVHVNITGKGEDVEKKEYLSKRS
jgi:hypothetical protein